VAVEKITIPTMFAGTPFEVRTVLQNFMESGNAEGAKPSAADCD